MFRYVAAVSVAVAGSVAVTPVGAQDMLVLDPSAYSRPMVMHGAINAQARRGTKSLRSSRPVIPARNCANKAQARAKLGSSHPGVIQLYDLCAKQGI